jgi:predicted HicB family RNase H-like nuclease
MAEAPGVVTGSRTARTMQVRLDGDLYEWLRAKSFFERRSMNTLIIEALARKRAIEAPHEFWHDRYLGR